MLEPTKMVKEALIKRTPWVLLPGRPAPLDQPGGSTGLGRQRLQAGRHLGVAGPDRPAPGSLRPAHALQREAQGADEGPAELGTDEATLSEQAEREQAAENQALEDLDQHGTFDAPKVDVGTASSPPTI